MRPPISLLLAFTFLILAGCETNSTADQRGSSEAFAIADEMLTLDFSLFDSAWLSLADQNYNIQTTTPDSSFIITTEVSEKFDLLKNPLPHFYPAEPSFLAARGRENYLFSKSEDSTQVKYTVASNPDAGGLNVISLVDIFVDKSANKVVYLGLTRNQKSQFFTESGTYHAELELSNNGVWLPKRWDFDVIIKLPFQDKIVSTLSADYAFD